MKGMAGKRWNEDKKFKMKEATEEILYGQDDEVRRGCGWRKSGEDGSVDRTQ